MKSLDAMIRYLILAFALFAAVPVAQAGMQGNLPAPVQKLPAYPPIVCITPDWRPESCATRQPPPLTGPVAKGATITAQTIEGIPMIFLSGGEIIAGDEIKFDAGIKDLNFPNEAVVFLNSEGGEVETSLLIANTIWARRFHTVVGKNALCSSMCGIIWLSGSQKWVYPSSRIGFHSPYFPDKRISPGGAAIIGAYLAKIGLSDAAIRYLTEAEPNSMNWLTAEKARQLGIDGRVLKENTTH
jgi:ATP-dependent protease ClpP protease subunit